MDNSNSIILPHGNFFPKFKEVLELILLFFFLLKFLFHANSCVNRLLISPSLLKPQCNYLHSLIVLFHLSELLQFSYLVVQTVLVTQTILVTLMHEQSTKPCLPKK